MNDDGAFGLATRPFHLFSMHWSVAIGLLVKSVGGRSARRRTVFQGPAPVIPALAARHGTTVDERAMPGWIGALRYRLGCWVD